MAILAGYPGLKVEIFVEDKTAQEYDDDEAADTAKSVTKYIEAVTGARFEARVNISPNFPSTHDLTCRVKADGETRRIQIIFQSDIKREFSCIFKGARSRVNGVTRESLFRFASLDTNEGTASIKMDALKSLGEIQVLFYFVKSIRPLPSTDDVNRELSSPTIRGKVPEKAVSAQAVSHTIITGEPETKKKVIWHKAELVEEQPFATFTFKYRSLSALKSLHVIPRTPDPSPEPESSKQPQPIPTAARVGRWHSFTLGAMRALLDHYTGDLRSWEGLDRPALEALMTHYTTTGSKDGKNGTNTKRGKREDDDDDDVIVTEERSKKRKCLPGPNDEVFDLD